MASQQGRRELGDRIVPLGYAAGRRATENAAGGHFQHPVEGDYPLLDMYANHQVSCQRQGW